MAIEHILEDGGIESQTNAETRLLALLGLPEGDLFTDREEMLARAYDKQAENIAYVEQPATSERKVEA